MFNLKTRIRLDLLGINFDTMQVGNKTYIPKKHEFLEDKKDLKRLVDRYAKHSFEDVQFNVVSHKTVYELARIR